MHGGSDVGRAAAWRRQCLGKGERGQREHHHTKDSTTGYAATFLQHLDAALEHLVANGIRLVVNAGGLNPAGLAAATRELIARRGYDLRISHVDGDDVFARLDTLPGVGGWENSVLLALTGTDLDAKAALVERSVHRYAQAVDGLDAVAIDRIGQAQPDPDSQNAGTQLLKITVQGTKEAAGRAFSSRMVELALSSYPGLYSLGPPQPGSAFGVYRPALLDQAVLEHVVHHHDGTTEPIAPGESHGAGDEVSPPAESLAHSVRPPWTADELVVAALGEIVHARSGDKGGDANLGVWVRNRAAWEWLTSTLTVDELRRLLPETRDLAISRYELPNLGAVNFVLRGLLGTGATSTMRLDSQAKALGEWLRARNTKVPQPLVKT